MKEILQKLDKLDDEKSRRLRCGLAAKMARVVLPLFEELYPDDNSVRAVIEMAESVAAGDAACPGDFQVTEEGLRVEVSLAVANLDKFKSSDFGKRYRNAWRAGVSAKRCIVGDCSFVFSLIGNCDCDPVYRLKAEKVCREFFDKYPLTETVVTLAVT